LGVVQSGDELGWRRRGRSAFPRDIGDGRRFPASKNFTRHQEEEAADSLICLKNNQNAELA
jgi:hypothetical protein